MMNFLSQAKRKSQPIDEIVDISFQNQVARNREILKPIVDTIILCGRTGTALRGHRDDAHYHPPVGEYSKVGVGNFVELLNYAVRRGDAVLKNHLLTCSKNSSYISKTIQNEIINCCGKVISDVILEEVRKAKFYTVIADECSDSSSKEQFSLVLRYVNSDMSYRKRFVFCLDEMY
jgi:hypothetical protein